MAIEIAQHRATDAATNLAPPPDIEEHWWQRIPVNIPNGASIGVGTVIYLCAFAPTAPSGLAVPGM